MLIAFFLFFLFSISYIKEEEKKIWPWKWSGWPPPGRSSRESNVRIGTTEADTEMNTNKNQDTELNTNKNQYTELNTNKHQDNEMNTNKHQDTEMNTNKHQNKKYSFYYSVIQSNGNSFGGDVVLDILNMA